MPMQQTAPAHANLSHRRQPRPRWRLAVLITVLAGFFLMHGLSGADSCASALTSLRADAQSSMVLMPASGTEIQTEMGAGSSHTSPADQCCAAMGTLCVPQRPQDDAWLLVLLLGLAMLVSGEGGGRLVDAVARTAGAKHRRHPRAGVPTRLLVCVSRT